MSAVPAASGVRGGAVVRAGVLSMVGLVALGGTRLVHGSLVSRATDHATFAKVGTLIGLAMAASLFLPGGLATAASRYIPFHRGAGDPASARRAYRVLTVAGYVCAVVFGAAVAAIALTLQEVSGRDAFSAGVLTATYSAYSVAKSSLYGFDRVVPYTWLEIAGCIVAVGGTVLVVVTHGGEYLAPLTAGYAVLMLGSLAVLRRGRGGATYAPAASPTRQEYRELSSYVWLMSLGGVASAGLLQALPVLAGWFTDEVEVAYFVAAVTLVVPLSFLPRALGLALFPAMSRAQGAGDVLTVRRQVDVSTRALFALLSPLFAAGILLAPEALSIFGGGRYAGGAAVLQVLLVATFVAAVQVGSVYALTSGAAYRIPAYGAVAGAAAALAALVPLGRWFGAAGVGGAYLLAVAVTTAIPLGVCWRRFGLSWTGPVLRGGVLVLGGLVVARVLDAAGPVGAGRTMLDVAAGIGVAAAGGLLLRGDIAGVLAARRD